MDESLLIENMSLSHEKKRSIRVVGRFYALMVTSLAVFLASFLVYPLAVHRVVADATVDLSHQNSPSATEVDAKLTQWLTSPECLALAIADLRVRDRVVGSDLVGPEPQIKVATSTSQTLGTTRVRLTLTSDEEALATNLLRAFARQVGEGEEINESAAAADQKANDTLRRASTALQEARLAERKARRQLATMLEDHFDPSVELTHEAEPTEREESSGPAVNPQWEALHRELQQLTRIRERMGHEMTAEHPLLLQTDYELSELRRRILEIPQFLFNQGASQPTYPGVSTVMLSERSSETSSEADPVQPTAGGRGQSREEEAEKYGALRERWQQSADALQQAEQAMHEAREEASALTSNNQPMLVTVVQPPRIVWRSGASLTEFRLVTQGGIALLIGLLVAWQIGRPVPEERIHSIEALQKAVSLPIVDAVDPATQSIGREGEIKTRRGLLGLNQWPWARFAIRLAEVSLIVVVVLVALAATSDRCLAEEIMVDPLTGLSHVTSVLFPL